MSRMSVTSLILPYNTRLDSIDSRAHKRAPTLDNIPSDKRCNIPSADKNTHNVGGEDLGDIESRNMFGNVRTPDKSDAYDCFESSASQIESFLRENTQQVLIVIKPTLVLLKSPRNQ